jgi:hypothetical protein
MSFAASILSASSSQDRAKSSSTFSICGSLISAANRATRAASSRHDFGSPGMTSTLTSNLESGASDRSGEEATFRGRHSFVSGDASKLPSMLGSSRPSG